MSRPNSPSLSAGASVLRAHELLEGFAARTGVSSDVPPRRYLWTDAFAVCTLLELGRATSDRECDRLAGALVAQVHDVLGRHRPDDRRTGWISGLGEDEGRAHPTRGGLRIGKPRPERERGERYDEREEWDRDGQYFHYLTRWMHALARAGEAAGVRDERSLGASRESLLRWAIELAETAHARFAHAPRLGARRQLHWKMSIDLSRPLVPSVGQHDPLDGLLTFLELAVACRRGTSDPGYVLARPAADLRAMCAGARWTTDDPLALGGLLCDAYRAVQLEIAGGALDDPRLCSELLRAATLGLSAFARSGHLSRTPSTRLAFRELGLSIGLAAVERVAALLEREATSLADARAIAFVLEHLRPYLALREWIEACWLDADNQASPAWGAHADINAVMLATSLAPDGYVSIRGA